jgi:hypothetical protein
MKKVLLSLLFVFLSCSLVFAQIDSPEKSEAYKLIVFDYKPVEASKVVDISIHRVYKIKVSGRDVEVLESETVECLPLQDGKYVFTSRPGLYKILITSYGEKLDKTFSYIEILGDTVNPTPPEPDPNPNPNPNPEPNPPDLDGLALEIYKAATEVRSDNKGPEAKVLATCFETIASRAAGLNMSPQQMATELSSLLKDRLTDEVRNKWSNFNAKYVDLMKTVSPDKDEYIAAYLEVAKGLKAIK